LLSNSDESGRSGGLPIKQSSIWCIRCKLSTPQKADIVEQKFCRLT